MLRKFKIKVDGTEYLVEMEELTDPALLAAAAPAPASAPAPAPAPAAPAPAPVPVPAAEPSPAAPAGDDAQLAPMPGKIVDIKASVGQHVEKNDVILILEAMKMENEVVAETSGTLKAVHVSRGDMVNPGDPLFTIG